MKTGTYKNGFAEKEPFSEMESHIKTLPLTLLSVVGLLK